MFGAGNSFRKPVLGIKSTWSIDKSLQVSEAICKSNISLYEACRFSLVTNPFENASGTSKPLFTTKVELFKKDQVATTRLFMLLM